MENERLLLIGIVLLSLLLLMIFLPLSKMRDAFVIVLFLQMLTWAAGLFAVEKEWIEYPVQLFRKENQVNQSSFTFEFFVFPVVAIFFSLKYPTKTTKLNKFLYYLLFTSFFTLLETIIERNTNLVHYIKWKWYWTLISVMIALFINHSYYTWFKKELAEVKS
jgi:hypothetical protein